MANVKRIRHCFLVALFLAGSMLGALGCGTGGPKTHPVRGRIQHGDVAALAGSHVEAALQGDANVRASGEIQPDGSFTLETLHAGAIRKGAPEGLYRVRIVLNDDDPASGKRAGQSVARRFLSFDTSGLSIKVPAEGNPVVKITPR